MKFIFALTVILFSSFSSAKDITDKYIDGEVYEVSALCPPGVMCVINGTAVTFKFELSSSCVNLLPLSYNTPKINEPQIVTVEALTQYVDAICTAAIEEKYETITLVNMYPPFQIEFANTGTIVDVKDFTK